MHDPPAPDDRAEVLLSARYGELEDVRIFVDTFAAHALDDTRDDGGNTVLHMAAGNGHMDVLAYLLPRVSPALLVRPNDFGSTPLHWAALNRHLEVARALVQFPGGPGISMIDVKNAAGRSPLGEAELAGWDEGARWFAQVMRLDEAKEQQAEEEEEEEEDRPSQTIEVEIQDADGGVAKMTIDPDASDTSQRP